jgi:hypothetical protein
VAEEVTAAQLEAQLLEAWARLLEPCARTAARLPPDPVAELQVETTLRLLLPPEAAQSPARTPPSREPQP